MATQKENIEIEIREFHGTHEAHLISEFMANSEPWVTLQRTYEDSIRMLNDPLREVYVADMEGEVVGFMILLLVLILLMMVLEI